jgi:sensor histidine kinase YesM
MTQTKESRIKEYFTAVIVSFSGATLMTFLVCDSCSYNSERFATTALFSSVMWLTMWIGNSELTHFINIYISWVEFPVKRFFVGMISTVVLTVAVAFGHLKLWEWAWAIKFNSYYEFIYTSLIITFLISLFLHGRAFLLQWKQTAVEAERYHKASIAATYESLKNQVNPHFLFNSLNVLTNLVYTDQDKAALFIKKMSDVYRYVLDTRELELVSVSDEMKFAESFIYLQQIRFGENLKVDNQMKEGRGMVVPLSIQMLIENAIKHNEVSTEHPLRIVISLHDGFISVSNNVQAKSGGLETNSGLGLDNIKKRYDFLTQQRVQINHLNGTFEVKIPVLNSNLT